MLGLYKSLEKLDKEGTPIRISLIGAGQQGSDLVKQLTMAPGMQIDIVIDLKIENAINAFTKLAGVNENLIEICDSVADAERALKNGKKVCSTRFDVACGVELIHVVVEATGVPQVYAPVAFEAIRNKKHMVTLNVEGDVCVGHILKMFADNAGVVYTGIYGDEPGNAMLLYSEAKNAGLPVLAMGRSEFGPTFLDGVPMSKLDWNKENTEIWLKKQPMPVFHGFNPVIWASFFDASKTAEEHCMMANATGLRPDVRGMHGPAVSFEEFLQKVPEILRLKKDGGILDHTGVIETIVPPPSDTIQPVWIYVVVPGVSGSSGNMVLHTTHHYVSMQAPNTIAEAVINHQPTVAPLNRRCADVITLAKKDLNVGDTIDEIGGFSTCGRVEVASVTRAERLLPFALARGAKVKKAVCRGSYLTYDDVEVNESEMIVHLRRLQDMLFKDMH